MYKNLERDGIHMLYIDDTGVPLEKIIFDKGGFEMSMSLDPRDDKVAYVSKKTTKAVEFIKGRNRLYDFFEEGHLDDDGLFKLEKDKFYIISTREKLLIPTKEQIGDEVPFVGEMIPYYVEGGEFRSHGAGFIEYGFGSSYENINQASEQKWKKKKR